jgi:molecular chaperone GrpE (heat shock protein)
VVNDEVDDNKIRQVLQFGYKLHEKIIRPAKVVVATFKK